MLQRKPCPVLHRRDLKRALITSPLWALAPQHAALDRVMTLPGSLACHGLGCKSAAAKGERGQTWVEALHSLEPSWEVSRGGGPGRKGARIATSGTRCKSHDKVLLWLSLDREPRVPATET